MRFTNKEINEELGRLHDIIINLKEENKLHVNRLARLLRYLNACSMIGQKDVSIQDIKEIISSNEMI